MGNRNGNKPILCEHGILGMKKCRECMKAYQTEYLSRPGKKERLVERGAAWKLRNPNSGRARTRRLSGIPVENGISPIGECPLCSSIDTLVPDHCHVTGKFRGWICGYCNRAFGFYQNYMPIFCKFDDYLAKDNK